MVRTEVKISMKKKYSACLYFKLLKVEKRGEEETKSMPHAPVISMGMVFMLKKICINIIKTYKNDTHFVFYKIMIQYV